MADTSTILCRNATLVDTDELVRIIHEYAELGIMLPRSAAMIAAAIDTFVVAEVDGRLVGCGSLCKLGQNLVEIRSLGISADYKRLGIGRKMVEKLTEQAKSLGIPKIMALTYQVGFFEKIGFDVVSKEIFQEKVWKDCVNCKKQHCCDEIAVLKRLD
ncbi:MAG: N-acetyltransferase [Gorillibacterium sp.]|nr:N-acetyltransferase [Gorillibacterium sp.]